MLDIKKRSGVFHAGALILFLVLAVVYFSPVELGGKIVRQGDSQKFVGMAQELLNLPKDGDSDVVAWLGSMFSGMPSYQVTVANRPEVHMDIFNKLLFSFDYSSTRIVIIAMICFYVLMCVMGISKWLAILGAIAYAFASYNFIILEAGHVTKAYVIAYMPLTLAGMRLLFQEKYVWGITLFTFSVATSIRENHLQVTYYLVLLCAFIYFGFVYSKFKSDDLKGLMKVSFVMLASLMLALLPNADNLYANWELSKTSTRGATELTTTTPSGEKISSGLDKDYAFAWSYGKGELLTLLVPNAYGGGSGGALGRDSELYRELRSKGAQVGKEVNAPTYWGEKSFTSGPVYFGALICFLFVLGMIVIANPMKWWLFAGSLFLTMLALGRNLDWFNDIMFHYLPMYNKFRTVEMALVIPGLVFPLIAVWGLNEILSKKVADELLKKGLYISLAITGGLSLILWLMPNMLLDFQSSYDAQYQLPDWYYNALVMDRESLASADALRSLLFIILGSALLFWFYVSKDREKSSLWVSVGFCLLVLADLWSVDRRYLDDSDFITPKQNVEAYVPSVSDKEIFKDTDPSYRVLNLSNTFVETNTSYYHKSIGGYHAAKLRRYQELIDHRLQGEINAIITSLQKARSADDLMSAFAATPSLNMLNARYIVYNPEQPPLRNPFAFGNGWFVDKIEIVDNADAEIEALNRINPLTTAVVDKRFASEVKDFVSRHDSTATIKLDSYQPNRLEYTTKANSDQMAIFSEIYYQPGWHATIDGKPAPHFRADWILRGMYIPAGEHKVVFEFKPQGYITASYISSYSSIIIILMLIGATVKSLLKWRKEGSE